MPEMAPCPVCGSVPHMGYCCGEYFVYCDDHYCPVGGNEFTEMHSSERLEIDAWNRRANWWLH